MKTFIACTTLCLACASGHASAASPGEQEAIAMSERAATMMAQKGKHIVVGMIQEKDPQFVHPTMYLEVRDLYTGIVMAHPLDPSMVGTDRSAAVGPLASQYPRQVIELAQRSGKGWVDYQYRHPATGVTETRSSYVLRVGDLVLEAAIKK